MITLDPHTERLTLETVELLGLSCYPNAMQSGLGPQCLSSFWADEKNARSAEIRIRYRGAISCSSVAWTAASIVHCIGHSEAC